MVARGWHGLISLCVVLALVLQLSVTVGVSSLPQGHAVGTLAGTHLLGRLVRVVSFFTIQSNVLAGLVSLQLALRPGRDGSGWRVLRLAALLGITVTGIVYAAVLAATHHPHGFREVAANDLFHYVVPVLMLLGWLLFGPRPRVGLRTALLAMIWPVLWLAYTLLAGAVSSWYPYPFVDVATYGYAQVLLYCLAVTAVFAIIVAIYAGLDRVLPAAPRLAAASSPDTDARAIRTAWRP
jgi:hypothetical protein